MGYVYHELLPVAVVMDQLGLDGHKLAEELSKVHFNWSDVKTVNLGITTMMIHGVGVF